MAIVSPIHNPDQDRRCLYGFLVRAGDWAVEDAQRFINFGTWSRALGYIRSVPHLEDLGAPICGDWCCPIQRENRWSERINCWERAKFAIAAATWLLPEYQPLTLWDRKVPYVDKAGVLRMGRHISVIEFDSSHNSLKPYYPADMPYPLANPALYLSVSEAANFDEAAARKYGAIGLDAAGGVLGAVAGAFGGPQAGGSVALAIKGVNDAFVRPGGAAAAPAIGGPALTVQHGLSTTTMIGLALAGLGGIAAISLLRK